MTDIIERERERATWFVAVTNPKARSMQAYLASEFQNIGHFQDILSQTIQTQPRKSVQRRV